VPIIRACLWALLALVALLIAIPAFFVWTFLLVDIAVGFGLNGVIKWLLIVLLVLPLITALYYLVTRTRAAMVSYTAQRPRIQPRFGWAIIGLLSFAGILVLPVAAFAVFITLSQPGAPGEFYAAPSPLPNGGPGTVVKSEPLENAPEGARAWKILYLTTAHTGEVTSVSGVLVVPQTPPPPGGRPIVAWAHGTVGISRNCAPSLRSYWAHDIDGLDTFLKAGYAVVATDYEGLGAPGAHQYLVGGAAAANVIDSVRAAHNFPDAGAGTSYAVWGASQGGHAALFTGENSELYAPDLQLVGVAAAAPPTDLTTLFERNLGTTFGNVLGAYAFASWSEVYGLDLGQIVHSIARPVVRNMASLCIREEEEAMGILPGSLFMKVTFLSRDPVATEPWKSFLLENSPGRLGTAAPILITQGEKDPLVRPDVTEAFVRTLCEKGDDLEFRSYPDLGHIHAGPDTVPDVATWIADRFAGKPTTSNCP